MFLRKGQVTVFIILGIVIMVVVIFSLVIASSLSKLKLQSQADKAVEDYLKSEAVNYYVYTCMDAAVTSSIDDLALQGGVFYTYQNGNYSVNEEDIGRKFIPYNLTFVNLNGEKRVINFNVSYSILNHTTFDCIMIDKDVPAYPKNRTFVNDLYGVYNTKNECLFNQEEGYSLSGFAGLNSMNRLCYIVGSDNLKGIKADAKGESGSIIETGLMPSHCYNNYILSKNKSVEYILQEQISDRLKNCTDFSLFVDDNITAINDPVTKITYNSESLRVETTYNFSVKIANKEPVIVKHSFNYESDLRIVRMHNFVMTLIKADSQDFLFNLGLNYNSYAVHAQLNPESFFDKDSMNVKLINFSDCNSEQCEPYKYDQLLIVTDNKSRIGNRSLTFVTAIKNRGPALDFIHTTSIKTVNWDIVVSNNENLTLRPMGYDPDDKKVTYDYDGWKEDYDESCVFVDEKIICEKNLDEYNVPVVPNNWSNSVLFQETGRLANYTTKTSDLGDHVVTISTTDVSGLYDYQIIKILVFDLPKASITLKSYYPNMDADKTSIEDPVPLDGSTSTVSQIGGGSISEYDWEIFWENSQGNWVSVFTNETSFPLSFIPSEIVGPLENKNIGELNKLIQTIKPLELSNTGSHNITLKVKSNVLGTQVESLIVGEEITTYECLPHVNSNDKYPYPYNTGDNPFMANHACCVEVESSGNYILQTQESKTICFAKDLYGRYADLLNDEVLLRKTNELSLYSVKNSAVFTVDKMPPSADSNDVFKMRFNRYCDGNRGNICAGNGIAIFEVQDSCNNKKTNIGEDESCQGPPTITEDEDAAKCVNYPPGESFETTFKLQGTNEITNGFCNDKPKCATIGVNGYNKPGHMLCVATCYNGLCENTRTDNKECFCRTGTIASGGCEAECDLTHPFKRTTNLCEFSCDTKTTCTLQQDINLPCPSTYSGQGYTNEYCKASISATNLNPAQNIIKDYCYYGTSCGADGGLFTRGDNCKAATIIKNSENKNCCVKSTSKCNSEGKCDADCNELKNCPANQQAICSDTGWICSSVIP